MIDLRQSTSSVSDYSNSFEELNHELFDNPSITTARLIRGFRTDLKRDMAYHRALEVEKLDKLYPVRRTAYCSFL